MTTSAVDIFHWAADHMEQHAAPYDQPAGERSVGRTVDAFSAITGHDLTAAQGWLFLRIPKGKLLNQTLRMVSEQQDLFSLAGAA